MEKKLSAIVKYNTNYLRRIVNAPFSSVIPCQAVTDFPKLHSKLVLKKYFYSFIPS
jgi:hypothetical protein